MTFVDLVALAGQEREAVLLGEAKWRKRADGGRIRAELDRKALALPKLATEPRFAVCARETVDGGEDILRLTAADIF